MKDIDFDELDRAVSSVLEPSADATPTPAAAVETTKPAAEPEKTPDVVLDAAPAVTEAAPLTAETEAPVATATPVAKTPLAIKRRGQFMDVVHPSSDMTGKPEEGTTAAPRKVTLQPISPSVVPDAIPPVQSAEEEPATDQPDISEASEVAIEPQPAVESVEATITTDQAIPDPLDVMQAQEETKDAASTETPAVEDTPEDASETAEVEATDEAAPTTPFLADTKVDKRPLDAFSPEETEEPAESTVEPEAPEQPLPPELQADVVAVEANPSDAVDTDSEKEATVTDKKDEVEAGFNTSIPQQYASAEAKADDDHSIFDTNEYHQPLAPTKVKKRGLPGWLVALFVMLLLAGLSAAGGYFWFYYGL